MQNIINALKNNNMDAFFADTKEDALKLLKKLLTSGETIAVGGSVTLNELGVIDLLRSGDYNFIDRYEDGISPEETAKRLKKGLAADTFICSSNAITKDGYLYNVDGVGNRVAAITYGPESVIIIAGKNKIVEDLKAAEIRVKTIAAPKNSNRLNADTYCLKEGSCLSLKNDTAEMCNGCTANNRICCNYVVTAKQRTKGRIKVILVNCDLGY